VEEQPWPFSWDTGYLRIWTSRQAIPLEALLTLAMEEDHGIRYSKLLFLKGLVDFEEADREANLTLLWDI
jgi:hypothetical protein